MPLIFSTEAWADRQQNSSQPFARLVLRTEQRPIRSQADYRVVRVYRREIPAGRELTLAKLDGGREGVLERLEDARATMTGWENVDVFGEKDRAWGKALTVQDAKACGFRNLVDLRAAWRARHPRSDHARLVWFVLGDIRDRDQYLAFTSSMIAGRQGDFTGNAHKSSDPGAPVPASVEAGFVTVNGQKDAARRAERERALAAESLAERVARIEAGGSEAVRIARRELAVIGQKTTSVERRLGLDR